MKKYRYLLIPAVCALITVLLFQTVFLIGYVPSSSMEPTLKKDSLIFGLRIHGELHDGDIIIFRHDGKLLVKRIAAGPGETVEHNGQTLTIPADCYYVLGDNAENSLDSRYWTQPFVREKEIAAKLFEFFKSVSARNAD